MKMDLSFDQISDLLDLFPDTFLYDNNPFLQENNPVDDDLFQLLITPPQNMPTVLPPQQPIHNSPAPIPSKDREDYKKKMISHRDTERQRRKEMTCLYRNLRSLLPIERLKGKRSASDHIHETVGYIKQLQNRIENLSQRRDMLKQVNSRTSSPTTTKETQSCSFTNVRVRATMVGMEVVISTASVGGVNLSRVLSILNEQGLSIIRCILARLDERLLHTIETEVMQETIRGTKSGINPSELQEKLANYFNVYHY